MECLTYVIHAVKIKVIDSFVLICTGTDRLDLITSSLFGELTYSFMIQRKGKGFFFFISAISQKEKNVQQARACQRWGKGTPLRDPGCSAKGVRISIASLRPLYYVGTMKDLKTNYLLSTGFGISVRREK